LYEKLRGNPRRIKRFLNDLRVRQAVAGHRGIELETDGAPHRPESFTEGTFSVRQFTSWSRDLRVTADGEGVVAPARTVGLQVLADRSG
jgi:hypothetical protein